jgi:hypothetical protein
MKTLKIEAVRLEPIKPTDATWEDWLRLAGATISMVLAIDGLCS